MRIPRGCRERLEKLCRYAARPPIVEDRLSLLPDGRVRNGRLSAAAQRVVLHEGKSGVFVLSERATKLLLLRNDAVVREVPLRLLPQQTLQLR